MAMITKTEKLRNDLSVITICLAKYRGQTNVLLCLLDRASSW